MKITWQLKKKRGNFRPTLNYTMVLEDFEQEMAVATLNIRSSLPKVDNPHNPHCLPGCHERSPDWKPLDFHYLATPYFKDGRVDGFLRLPFRESGDYPEIEASFTRLNELHEARVREAYGWKPLALQGELDLGDETRRAIAATLIARKLLSFS